MSTENSTTHIGLNKPSENDYYDINVSNNNMDIIDQEFIKHDTRISNIEMLKAIRSEPSSTRNHVTALPINTVGGGKVEILNIEGLSAVQVNQKANTETTVTSDNSGTKILLKKDGSWALDNTYNADVYQTFPIKNGDKFFVYGKAKEESTSSGFGNIGILYDNGSGVHLALPNSKEQYGILEASHDGRALVYLSEGGSGDLTRSYQLTVPLVGKLNDLTLDQLVDMARNAGYWEGIKPVESVKLVSRGKNISRKLEVIDSNWVKVADHNDFEVGETYHSHTLGGRTKVSVTTSSDASDTLVDLASVDGTFTWTKDASNKKMSVFVRDIDDDLETNEVQVERGLVPTAYEPYQEDRLAIEDRFYSLPNGVCDDLEYQRTVKINLRGNADYITTTGLNVNLIRIPTSTIIGLTSITIQAEMNNLVMEGHPAEYANDGLWDDASRIGGWYSSMSENLYIITDKSVDTVVKANEYIEGLGVIYQLAEPIIRVPTEGSLSSFEEGDIIMTSESGLIPEVTFDTPLNQGAVVEDIHGMVLDHDDFLKRMTGITVPPKTMTQENPTLLFDLNNGGGEPTIKGSGQRVTNLAYNFENGYYVANGATSGDADGKSVRSGSIKVIEGQILKAKLHSEYTDFNWRFRYFDDNNAAVAIHQTSGGEEYTSVVPVGATILRPYVLHDTNTSVDVVNTKFSLALDGEYLSDLFFKGTQSLSDVAFEVRGENLCYPDLMVQRSGYTTGCIEENNGFTVTEASGNICGYLVPVEPHKIYSVYYEGDLTYTRLYFFNDRVPYSYLNTSDGYFISGIENNGFNSGESFVAPEGARFMMIGAYCDAIGEQMKNITVVQGSISPTKYIPPVKHTAYMKGNEVFGDTDTFEYKDGKIHVEREWSNEIVLDSSLNWVFHESFAGFKRIRIVDYLPNIDETKSYEDGNLVASRYDGKNLFRDTSLGADCLLINVSGLFLSIDNNASGWGESYEPTIDEIKAYLNGWVMYGGGETLYTTGTKRWMPRYQGIGTKYATQFGAYIDTSASLYEIDCPIEKAYGAITECYKLQYKLVKPKSYQVDCWGTLPMPEGKTYVTMHTGVRMEKVSYDNAPPNFTINVLETHTSYNNVNATQTKKVKRFLNVIGELKTGERVELLNRFSLQTTHAYGKSRLGIQTVDIEDVDWGSLYVVYETLPEENNSGIFEASITYHDDAQAIVEQQGNLISQLDNDLAVVQAKLADLEKIMVFEPTLLNGATVYVDEVRVVKIGNYVQLEGYLSGSSFPSESVVFKLPEEFRPTKRVCMSIASKPTSSRLYNAVINTNGEVTIQYEASASWCALGSIRYAIY